MPDRGDAVPGDRRTRHRPRHREGEQRQLRRRSQPVPRHELRRRRRPGSCCRRAGRRWAPRPAASTSATTAATGALGEARPADAPPRRRRGTPPRSPPRRLDREAPVHDDVETRPRGRSGPPRGSRSRAGATGTCAPTSTASRACAGHAGGSRNTSTISTGPVAVDRLRERRVAAQPGDLVRGRVHRHDVVAERPAGRRRTPCDGRTGLGDAPTIAIRRGFASSSRIAVAIEHGEADPAGLEVEEVRGPRIALAPACASESDSALRRPSTRGIGASVSCPARPAFRGVPEFIGGGVTLGRSPSGCSRSARPQPSSSRRVARRIPAPTWVGDPPRPQRHLRPTAPHQRQRRTPSPAWPSTPAASATATSTTSRRRASTTPTRRASRPTSARPRARPTTRPTSPA